MPDTCTYCNKPLNGSYVGVGDSYGAHSYCYELVHRPGKATTTDHLFSAMRDPVLGRQLIAELPPSTRECLIAKFNQRFEAQQRRRMKFMKEHYEEEHGPHTPT